MRRTTPRARPSRLGMTLIELSIALAIGAAIAATAVVGINAITDANLRSAAVTVTGVVKANYDRAVMLQRTQRLVLDIDNDTWWVEFTTDRFGLSQTRVEGTEGEGPKEEEDVETESEKPITYSSIGSLFQRDEADIRDALEKGIEHNFSPDTESDSGTPQKLPSGVHFSRIWTGHQEEPFTEGKAYIHFFRGGWGEPAFIELVDDQEDVVSLRVSPLTGRVRSYHKKFEDPDSPDDYDGRDEGDL